VTRAFVGLGSNLGDREATILRALARLQDEPELRLVRVSSLRETEPVGYVDQPQFLNGVAELETGLPARDLLTRLLAIERELGRTRGEGPTLGPRTIDLDLLLYGEETIAEAGLQVPHPRMHERRFALEPLAELDPSAVIPGRGQVQTLLAELESPE
jgi:2-amino-4-hydroxy-6-hydroxymethyldihydropteridine diphosphokinase